MAFFHLQEIESNILLRLETLEFSERLRLLYQLLHVLPIHLYLEFTPGADYLCWTP